MHIGGPHANATCNLNECINFTVDPTMAAFMHAQDSIPDLSGAGMARAGNRAPLAEAMLYNAFPSLDAITLSLIKRILQ